MYFVNDVFLSLELNFFSSVLFRTVSLFAFLVRSGRPFRKRLTLFPLMSPYPSPVIPLNVGVCALGSA